MTWNPEPPPSPTIDQAKEHRLERLRREAEATGRVKAPGVRAQGGPAAALGALPQASRETGYYGLPLAKRPTWIWTVPVYFFVGGAAGAAAIIAAMARWTRAKAPLVRDARRLALAGSAAAPALLIADLGRPNRFMNMLRVMKPQSPMSVGAWTLAAFSGAVTTATAARSLAGRAPAAGVQRLLGPAAGAAGDAAESAGALLGGVMATYTGVLVGVTTIPVWANNVRLLPFHFGASGMASASGLLELRHDDPALRRIGIGTAAAETLVGLVIEADRSRTQAPLKHGFSGRLTRLGGMLSGPGALALRLIFGRRRGARRAAAAMALVGSLITRFAWIEAGKQSAEDPRDVVGLPDTPRER